MIARQENANTTICRPAALPFRNGWVADYCRLEFCRFFSQIVRLTSIKLPDKPGYRPDSNRIIREWKPDSNNSRLAPCEEVPQNFPRKNVQPVQRSGRNHAPRRF